MNNLNKISSLITEIVDDGLVTFSDGIQFSDYQFTFRTFKRCEMIYNCVIDGALKLVDPREWGSFMASISKELFKIFKVTNEEKGRYGVEATLNFINELKALIIEVVQIALSGSKLAYFGISDNIYRLAVSVSDVKNEIFDLNTEEVSKIIENVTMNILFSFKDLSKKYV